jgi:hypothetical protein
MTIGDFLTWFCQEYVTPLGAFFTGTLWLCLWKKVWK